MIVNPHTGRPIRPSNLKAFIPSDDITVQELAYIVVGIMQTLRLMIPEEAVETMPLEIQRHFMDLDFEAANSTKAAETPSLVV